MRIADSNRGDFSWKLIPTMQSSFFLLNSGASTHYLLLSPSTRGLFSKAISQSGVASVPFAFDSPEVMKENVQRFTSAVGCNLTDSVNIVDCLRSRSKDELLMAGMLDSVSSFLLTCTCYASCETADDYLLETEAKFDP